MSGNNPADDQGPQHVRSVRMSVGEAPDAQERVMSWSAYDLKVRATAHSATSGRPGFVPDDYLENLNGLGLQATITADELCTVGLWERTGGGYRILGQVRRHTGEDLQALTREPEHAATAWARMAEPVVVTPPLVETGAAHGALQCRIVALH